MVIKMLTLRLAAAKRAQFLLHLVGNFAWQLVFLNHLWFAAPEVVGLVSDLEIGFPKEL